MTASSARFRVRRSLLVTLVLAVSGEAAASLMLTERWREITAGTQVQASGFAAGDFDDDGLPDMAMAVDGPALIVRIEGSGGGEGWRTKQVIVVDSPVASPALVPVAWTVPGADRLLLLDADGEAIEFRGWPLRETRRFPIATGARAAVVGDIDADGVAELVLAGTSAVFVYSLDDGGQRWSVPQAAYDVRLAQLDADAALEILLAATPGVALDGATRAVDWSYPDGFGVKLAVGRFGTDAMPWFAGARDYATVLVFRASPWSPVWDFENFDTDAVAACDAGGDARDELIVADGQWGDVHVVDAATRATRLSIEHREHGTLGLAAADFDGDRRCDIAFAGRVLSSFGPDHLYHVYDSATGETSHSLPAVPGNIDALAIADLDGDGVQELIVATASESTRLRVADLATGRVRWEVPPPGDSTNATLQMSARRVMVGQADGDTAPEIVLAGTSGYDGRVLVIDSATREVQRQIGTYSDRPMRHRRVVDAQLLDYDRNGQLDIVVGTVSFIEPSAARLQVFALGSGDMLWESVAMGTDSTSLRGLLVAQSDSDPAAELIAVLTDSLRAYDADSKLLDWSFAYHAPISSFAFDTQLQELAVADGSVVNYYALGTRQFLRSIDLGGAVSGLAWLPGSNGRYVARAGEELVVFDPFTAGVLDRSGWIGATLAETRPATVATPGAWRVASGGQLGYFLHEIGIDPMRVFSDGFEP